MAHINGKVVREAYAAFGDGDFEKMASLFADEPVWHVPGRSKLAGAYRGADTIFGYFEALDEATSSSYQIGELHDVLANDHHAVSLHKSSGSLNGETIEFEEVLVWHFSNGKISEVWEHTNPSHEYDEMVGR